MTIDNKFEIGQIVYLITDKEQYQRIVTGITVRESGIVYTVAIEMSESYHMGFEMSNEVNQLIKVT